MNREETKKAIKVMQGYADGENIQAELKSAPGFYDMLSDETPAWNFQALNYRIKPKPLECWSNVYSLTVTLLSAKAADSEGFSIASYDSPITAREIARNDSRIIRTAVHMREVTDETKGE